MDKLEQIEKRIVSKSSVMHPVAAIHLDDAAWLIARVRELEEDRSLSSEMIEQFTEGCKKQGARIKALEEEVESLKNDAKGCEDHCQHLQDRLDARDGLGAAGEDEKHKEEAGIAYDDLPPINITGDLSAEEHIQRLRDGE